MHTILVRQPAGIGDIFFCQYIANYFARLHNARMIGDAHIVWPVKPEFLYVKDYLINRWCIPTSYVSTEADFPYKELYNSSEKKIIKTKELTFLPLHGHDLVDDSVMKSKYKFVELDWSYWREDFAFVRNSKKERELFYDYLKIKDDEPFVFVNNKFASPPDVLIKPFSIHCDGMRQVELQILPEFTIFDWCMVLERATHIITVETSLNYLIDVLNIKASKLMMLSKWSPADFHHIDSLFNRPWTYVR